MVAQMLEHKQAWRGGLVQYVCTLYKPEMQRVSQSKFQCVQCSHSENADRNAARNILAAGHAVFACGVGCNSNHGEADISNIRTPDLVGSRDVYTPE